MHAQIFITFAAQIFTIFENYLALHAYAYNTRDFVLFFRRQAKMRIAICAFQRNSACISAYALLSFHYQPRRVVLSRRIRIFAFGCKPRGWRVAQAKRQCHFAAERSPLAGLAIRGERGDVPYTRLGRSAEVHRNPGSGTPGAPDVPHIRATAFQP